MRQPIRPVPTAGAPEAPRPEGSTDPERVLRAVAQRRFELDLQPIRCLSSRSVQRYEVLLRLVDFRGRSLAPSEFLGPAIRGGVMRELDRWVVRRVVRLLALWDGGPCLDVNLSPESVVDPRFSVEIANLLESEGVEPGRLGFEITEEAAIADLDRAGVFVRRLRGLGCHFAIDDFGTGYASLASLRDLPVNSMKIDGSFIRDLAKSVVDRRLVAAIVEVARALELETVAEYVLDEASAEFLLGIGVDLAQGDWAGSRVGASEMALDPGRWRRERSPSSPPRFWPDAAAS